MTDFYTDLDDIFQECMAEFDCRTVKVQLVGKSSQQMNPATREYEFTNDAPVDLVAITISFNKSVIDGDSIRNGDIRVIIGKDFKPEQDSNVLIDGDNYSIVDFTQFNAGGRILGYDMQVRR